ncbi:MAG: L-threonine 3-dehydrogenase [Cyanobacteria bacterium]|nr:L-threonine 3-dehydrogenase [Cyanobacteriota bacterium]
MVTCDPQTQKQQMKAIRKSSPSAGFELVDVNRPEIGPDEVLIKVSLASICGTDLHITNWDEWSASRIKPPLIYGHEFCGIVEAVGETVENVAPGDFVSAEMHLPCGVCYQCMTGKFHICENVKIAGIDLDGCYAEYLKLPKRQIFKLPKSMSPAYGACLDSLGNAVHAVSKGNVSGKSVLVVGCGPIGLFSIRVAMALGATRVYASDISPYRLEMAEKAGATQVFAAHQTKVSDEIKKLTQGHGVDVVLEMSGSDIAINDGFKALKLGGTMVMLGIPKGKVTLDITQDVIFKEATIVGVNGREMFQTWFLMLELLESGKLDIDFIITHRFPLAEFGKAIELVALGNSGKILLEP